MNSILLSTILRALQPLLLIVALLLLLRGHNSLGGGFVGGLVAAVAPAIHGLAITPQSARRWLRIKPEALVSIGLGLMIATGLLGPLAGSPFLRGLWMEPAVPIVGTLPLGSPLLFDAGVFLAVMGVVLTIAFSLMETD